MNSHAFDSRDAPHHQRIGWRLGLYLALAALPILAIPAHVFDLVPMHLSAGLLVVPLLVAVLIVSGFWPLRQDRTFLFAAATGAVATAVYDAIRLDTVYLLGWWGDFIPRVGSWILDTDDPTGPPVAEPGGAVVLIGYAWRYAGDGAGVGVWFFVLAAALGLRDRGRGATVLAAVAFSVVPVWAGLIGTVSLAPRASELMFPLTTSTLLLSLLGHLLFGVVLGLGCARCPSVETLWPWSRALRTARPPDRGPLRERSPGTPPHSMDEPGGWGSSGLQRSRSNHLVVHTERTQEEDQDL